MKNVKSEFTAEFLKDYVNDMFYNKDNSEQIKLVDLNDGTTKDVDLAKYLNVEFYAWLEKVEGEETDNILSVDAWVNSKLQSLDGGYALVESYNESATESADLDNGVIEGKITFLIQTDKIKNLDYYLRKLRNRYMGEPIIIQNSFGKKVKSYFMLGTLLYEEEPIDTQLGYCLVASCNFSFRYMVDALSYNDLEVSFSIDNGKNFYDIPLIAETWQLMSASTSMPYHERPDMAGFVVSTYSTAKTYSFFDYNEKFNEELNNKFFTISSAYSNNVLTKKLKDLQVKILIKLVYRGKTYLFNDVIDNVMKDVKNGQFSITSIALKGSATPLNLPIRYIYSVDGNLDGEMSFTQTKFSRIIGLVGGGYSLLAKNYMLAVGSITINENTTTKTFLPLITENDETLEYKERLLIQSQNKPLVEISNVEKSISLKGGNRVNYIEINTRPANKEYVLGENDKLIVEMSIRSKKTSQIVIRLVSNEDNACAFYLYD